MSYDIWLEISTGKDFHRIMDVGNYTSNVSPMWSKAIQAADNDIGVGIASLGDMAGHEAAAMIGLLQGAIVHMRDHQDEYLPLNPKNGWGDYEGALQYLKDLLAACEQHPLCTIGISR